MNKKKNIIIFILALIILSVTVLIIFNIKKEKNYEIRFVFNNGLPDKVITVVENSVITEPEILKNDGYDFEGWYLNNVKYDFSLPVNSNILLEAKWKLLSSSIKWLITLDLSDGKTEQIEVINGDKVGDIQIPTRDGYIFDGWNLNGNKIDDNTIIMNNWTLKAIWKSVNKEDGKQEENQAEEVKEYTVIFNFNNDTKKVNQIVKDGSLVKKPNDPEKKGHTFVEWQLDGKNYDFLMPINMDIELTAIWKKNIYNIVFNSDGGTPINKQEVEYNNKVTIPNVPEKNGYTFVEWQQNNKKYDFDTVVDEDLELKAIWKKNIYTISFDSNGGSNISSQTVEYGNKIIKPNNPSKDGYEFVEWQLNGKTYDFNLSVKSNITLKAVWIKNIFSVTFNSNGGSNVDSQKVNKGNTVTKPTNPSKDGYEFVEWQLNGTTYNFDTPVTSDITLIVKWKKTVFNVGDELSIADEEFYVIRLLGNQLTLLAKYTLGPNYRQSSVDNPVKFANNKSWGYGGEINVPAGPVRTYLDEYLKYLNVVTNNNIQGVDLMSISTPKGFGLNLLHELCYTNSHIFHNGQDYWTSTGVEGSSYRIHYISGTRCMESEASYEGKLGVRPIIRINKDYFQ